jgi:hypothetical protein
MNIASDPSIHLVSFSLLHGYVSYRDKTYSGRVQVKVYWKRGSPCISINRWIRRLKKNQLEATAKDTFFQHGWHHNLRIGPLAI